MSTQNIMNTPPHKVNILQVCELSIVYLLFVVIPVKSEQINWKAAVNLPEEHLAPYFFNDRDLASRCHTDHNCPFKKYLSGNVCWGYEEECQPDTRYHDAECAGDPNGWVESKAHQMEMFDKQADFGYIRERKSEFFKICRPRNKQTSKMECIKNLRFCRGNNIFINLTSLINMEQQMRYRMDVLSKGQIGGHCLVDESGIKQEIDHMSPLQSWAPEIQNFGSVDEDPFKNNKCDVVFNKKTYIMKLDATVNMYHHFCDFVNLYATLHLNANFSEDINILIWDTMPYRSNFGVAWKAFTKNPILDLHSYVGKTICFKDVVLPLLPRMIFGMYYNMPLISGCSGSGFFRAFNRHFLHKLNIKRDDPENKNVKITILSRSTQYRKILNQKQLLDKLKTEKNVKAQIVDFNWNTPFMDQLKIIHNTDVLIGMHGAGLTHMLFLPDWAAVFEIYNCEDGGCYHDLAHVRGVEYFTWEKIGKLKPQDQGNHPTEGAHAKFTNYEFNPDEFLRIVRKAIKHVRKHSKWQQHDEL